MSRVEHSLPDLQFHLKKDPETYKKEFESKFEAFECLDQSFRNAPSEDLPHLRDVILFISQVVQYFPEYVERFAIAVTTTILSRSFGMNPEMRMSYLQVYMRLRTKDLITSSNMLEVAFQLHRCHDKPIRRSLRTFIINDFKRINTKHKSHKLNSSGQEFLAKMTKDANPIVAREAVYILVQLFVRKVWDDVKTANILANDACLAKSRKVYALGIKFFLGKIKAKSMYESDGESDSEMNPSKQIKYLQLGHRVGIKSNKRQKRLQRNMEQVRKKEEKKAKNLDVQEVNFAALNMIHDPQTFAERLLKKLDKCNDNFETRLLLLELTSRLVGLFKLILLNLYPALQRFLKPQQREITHLLLYAAQASHDQVPPDVMEPLVRVIADNFITERASTEAMAVGLNAIRELCARCPYAMTEDLLSDLVEYKNYKNKNVVAASRSLIRLFRDLNPSILPKTERGRPTDASHEMQLTGKNVDTDAPALTYGAFNNVGSVPGSEFLLLKEKKEQTGKKIIRMTDEERLEALTKATDLTADRILSDEDFAAMKRYMLKKKSIYTGKGGQKRKVEEDEEDEEDELDVSGDEGDESEEETGKNPDIVSLNKITHLVKRARASKAERLETVEEGRKDRDKYGFKVSRLNPHASTTNREKRKTKSFGMVKHKAKQKVKRSFKEKQIRLREHLLKIAKMSR
ncbi:Protein SDA1 [Cichlidogyrus casuarinus]|uniref:Protein SDA1 n=1 Tax=Cichlidogyrus casuarinus TaxID=1844966 RepID=A0ABD2PVU6_9PLAT